MALLAATAVAVVGTERADAAGLTTFSTPSRAVYCFVEPASGVAGPGVQCAVPSASRQVGGQVPHPEWAYFEIRSESRTERIATDNVPNAGIVPRIPYGATWSVGARQMSRHRRAGAVNCTSRTTGLTCRNRRGHGFALSRERQRAF